MCVFCKIKHSFTLYLSTLYLSLVPYRSTDSQTSKNIHSFLVKQELVEFLQRTLIEKLPIFLINTLLLIRFHKHSFTPYPSLSGQVGISSFPSKNADRKITNFSGKHSLLFCSHKHSFTPYPSLGPYHRWTELQTEKQINLLHVGWRNFFSVVLLCQFFGCCRKQFQVLLTYHTSCAIVSYFCCGGKQFWVAQISFLVVAGNSFRCFLLIYHTSCAVVSVFWQQWEIVFGCTVSKKDSYSVSFKERESASKCVYFVRSNTLLLCISLLCIYLLYRTDPQTHRLDRFLKYPQLSGQVGISRIPSKNANRKITNLSGKHSFTHSVS